MSYFPINFEEFVTTPPPRGLGTSIKALKRLCIDEEGKEIVRLTRKIEKLVKEKRTHGGDRKSNKYQEEIKPDNIRLEKTKIEYGTSSAYAKEKLDTERPDLYKKVEAGELSPHKAMVEAGFRKKQIYCYNTPEDVVSMILRHFEDQEIREIIGALSVGR